jgi:hypothetical protein
MSQPDDDLGPGEYVAGERHIEMTWRCSSCQHQNLGRHKSCQGCGNPKDASEDYEMPADPASAPSVTDAALLRMATAGPDWRCAYCGSDQRRDDNSCANCGAAAAAGLAIPDAPPHIATSAPGLGLFRRRKKLVRNVGIGVGVTGAVIGALAWNALRPRDYDATVSAVAWEHVIEVEKYANRTKEGFRETIPSTATDIISLGQRVHHHEQVLDHYETEYYSVQVPDGYRTEYYTAREACGQDCTTTPRSCRQSCTTSKNGFASCRQICSGGDRRCTTRYCSRQRTRQVAKTRSERRSRQVPKYRSEPRYAEAFSYKNWEWAHDRTERESGTDTTNLKWPAGARTLADGEKERDKRRAKYVITLRYEDEHLKFEVPSADRFAEFAVGSEHDIHRDRDAWSVDGTPITPLAD